MAITQVYVDPAINGNSGTGTIGDPYGDLQYALNTKTRDATNGDQFNVKAGTAEVLAAALTLATYGTPTATAPLVIRGYTSAANDGGIGDINGGGSYTMFASTTYDYVHIVDMTLRNTGANMVVRLRYGCLIDHCTIHTNSNGGNSLVYVANNSVVANCYMYNGGRGITAATLTLIFGNYIYDSAGIMDRGVSCSGTGISVVNNVIRMANVNGIGIAIDNAGCPVVGNSLYNSTAGVKSGIVYSAGYGCSILNNIIEGWSGVGGEAIDFASISVPLVTGNAYYNNTATYTSQLPPVSSTNEDTLAASAFTAPASGNFAVNGTIAGVTEDAYPSSFNGASTTNKMDKGAVQAGAGSGGVTRSQHTTVGTRGVIVHR